MAASEENLMPVTKFWSNLKFSENDDISISALPNVPDFLFFSPSYTDSGFYAV